MAFDPNPQLVALFGSETRVSVLAALAGASKPFTGYRVAKVADVQPIKAYAELRRLRDAGVVQEIPGKQGGSLWELPQGEIRSYIGKRARVSWSQDWMDGTRRQVTAADRVFASQISEAAGRRTRPKSIPPGARAILSQMVRPAQKDAILQRLGLPTSVRQGHR
jgi:hypothetical protein